MFTKLSFALVFTFSLLIPVSARPGDYDTTFNLSGYNRIGFGNGGAVGKSMAMQQDGKYVVAGECSDGLGVNVGHVNVCLARFENNGTLDVSFGEGGSTSTWLGKDFSSNQGSVAIQNDGRIVVAGNLLDPISYRAFVLLRYNTDGSQDTSFGRNGIVIGQVGPWPGSNISGIVIQPDGQIIAAGWVNDGVTAQMMCARFNSDGSLDENFGNAGVVTTSFGPAGSWVSASAIALQTDNKIIIIGTGLINGKFQFAAERLWSEGTLDARFGKGGKSVIPFTTDYLSANAVAIQPDGKILIAGTTSLYNDPDIAVARLSINGQLDRSFDGDGKLVLTELAHRDQGNAVFVQADGEILVTGTTYSTFTQGLVARILSDGERDKSHNRNGIIRFGNNAATYGALAHPDGDLTLAGSTSDSPVRPGPMAIFQVNEKALDQSFGNGGQSVGPLGNEPADLQDMAIQPDGKIIVAGTTGIRSYLNERGALARFDINGRLDQTFGQGGKVTLSNGSKQTFFQTVTVQNGKIAAAGYLLEGYRYDIFVAQFDTNGILDQTFGNGGIVISDLPASSSLGSILFDSLGRVVVAGGSGNEFLVLRYTPNGSPDPSFGSAGIKTIAFSGPAGASFVRLLPDSKLLLGGGAQLATSDLAMARLNSDGTLDQSFGQNGTTTVDFDGSSDYFYNGAVLPDGKFLTVGTSGNGSVFHTTLVRFNSDGTLDQTFGNSGKVVSPVADFLDEGRSIALQSDGKILVAAYAYRTFGSDFIVLRFNQDGSLDSSSFGKNGTVRVEFDGTGGKGRRIAVDAFGNIVLAGLAGGEFGVARLVGDKSARCVATVKRDLRDGSTPCWF